MSYLSTCCDALPYFDLQEPEDGICSDCGEHSEFYDEESEYLLDADDNIILTKEEK